MRARARWREGALLEERTDTPNITTAFAVHARTLELLDARGLADVLLSRGVPVCEVAPPGGGSLNLRELPTRFGMVLIVPQSGRILRSALVGAVTRLPRGRRLLGERLSGICIAGRTSCMRSAHIPSCPMQCSFGPTAMSRGRANGYRMMSNWPRRWIAGRG